MITLKVSGLEKMAKFADRFPAIAQKYADEAITRSIGEIARKMQPLVPVDTARLKNSFTPKFSPFEGRYGTDVSYAEAVHGLYSPGTSYKNPSKNKNAVAGFLEIGAKESKAIIDAAFEDALIKMTNELALAI